MAWKYTLGQLAGLIGAEAPRLDGVFSGVSTDSRSIAPGQVFFALSGENFDGGAFVEQALKKGAAGAVTAAPGSEANRITVDDPLAALQNFAARHREQFRMPLTAITGSCGKTTAKDMIAALLGPRYAVVKTRGNLNNEIGCPLSLLQIDGNTEHAIIEMGANHPGEIAQLCRLARPTESAVTMVAAAHLEGFGSIERVAEAKAEIVAGLPSNGRFYVNVDDPRCMAMAERRDGPKIYYGSEWKAPPGVRLGVMLKQCNFEKSGEMVLDINPVGRLRLPLPLRALATNVLLAIAVGLQHRITNFEGPLREACARAARCKVLRLGPMEVLDDTYNANPASMAAALEGLGARPGAGNRIAALGEMLELGEMSAALHAEAGECVARNGVTHLFARGPHARDMIDAARANGVPHVEMLEEHAAMAKAIHAAAAGGAVLLLKGSRGMRMEQVLEDLKSLYADS